MDNKEWVDFLFKKIEQTQVNVKSSGVTIWAILAVLALVFKEIYTFVLTNRIQEYVSIISIQWILITSIASIILCTMSQQNTIYGDTTVLPNKSFTRTMFLYLALIQCSILGAQWICLQNFKILHFLQLFLFACNILMLLLLLAILMIMKVGTMPLPLNTQPKERSKFYHMLSQVFSPNGLQVITLACYSLILMSGGGILNDSFAKSFYFTILIFTVVFLISKLITTRAINYNMHELINIQDNIVVGKLSDADSIKEHYEDIMVGQTLTRWAREFWLKFQKEIASSKILVEEYQIEIDKLKECMPPTSCKECVNKEHIDMMNKLLSEARQKVNRAKEMIKMLDVIEIMYKDSAISAQLSQKDEATKKELLNLDSALDVASKKLNAYLEKHTKKVHLKIVQKCNLITQQNNEVDLPHMRSFE